MSDYRLKGASDRVMGKNWPLAGEVLIGRAAHCDLHIDDDQVAAEHARIAVSGDTIRIKDLDSPSGTYVNGTRVSAESLGQGDEIRIGRARLMVQAPGLRPDRLVSDGPSKTSRPGRINWWLVSVLIAAGAALAWYLGWIPV